MPASIDHTQLNAVARAIAARRSVRRYVQEPVPREVIEEILRCAVNAPSAHNRQPWRFVVIQDPASKSLLADAMGNRLRADRLQDGDSQDAVEADVARSRERIVSAPVVIVVSCTIAEMDAYPDAPRREAEYLMAVQSTAMAVENLLLAAHAAGLAGCWMCAPLFCPEAVQKVLMLPADWRPQAAITLGIPASKGRNRARRELAEVVRYTEPA